MKGCGLFAAKKADQMCYNHGFRTFQKAKKKVQLDFQQKTVEVRIV